MRQRFILIAVLLLQASCGSLAFLPCLSSSVQHPFRSGGPLAAKKKAKKNPSSGVGFGKVEDSPKSSAKTTPESATAPEPTLSAPPKEAAPRTSTTDSNLPPEERTKQILREQFGMKTLEEQQASEKQMQALKAQRKRLDELKRKAELEEDIDVIAMIPAPILKGLDTFLKAGVGVSGTLFILAGFAITAEAWSKASGQALPEDVDNFIVNVVEPNFTPGLLVVLGFSIALGFLATASLGSEGAQYREK